MGGHRPAARGFVAAAVKTLDRRPVPDRDPTLVSVVLVALDAAATIEAQLEGLMRQTYDGSWELIVVDNGSTDSTCDAVRRWAEKIPYLRLLVADERHDPSYARNAGVLQARGDFLVFCDSDDVVESGWLAAMAASAPRCHIVGGRHEISSLENPLGIDPGFDINDLHRPESFLPYAGAANMGIWREVFEEMGGWDEGRRDRAEDIDLSWRAQLAGFGICFASEAVIHYRLRATVRGLARQSYNDGLKWPRLYRDFRGHGMRRSSLAHAAATWGWLVAATPTLLASRTRRAVWIRRAAHRWGRFVGSFRQRVVFL